MRYRPWFLLFAVLLACAGPACAPATDSASTTVAVQRRTFGPAQVVIDMFGTEQITLEHLLAVHGAELRTFAEALMRGDHAIDTEALLDKLYALGKFADVTPALVPMNESGVTTYYLTIDFVDHDDAPARMPFLPEPSGTYRDPEGLLADWRRYELMALASPETRRASCPAFHCLGGDRQPGAATLTAKFAARVPAHVEELATILRDDRRALHRAAAASLLAYAKDGPALVKRLVAAFRDGEAFVRNSAMRVVADIALYHHDVEVPVEPVLEALRYPATLDRNKAAAILDGLLSRPNGARLRRTVAVRAGATLLAMLRLQQPNNHRYAYRILKAISGQHFEARDYTAWECWLRRQAGKSC